MEVAFFHLIMNAWPFGPDGNLLSIDEFKMPRRFTLQVWQYENVAAAVKYKNQKNEVDIVDNLIKTRLTPWSRNLLNISLTRLKSGQPVAQTLSRILQFPEIQRNMEYYLRLTMLVLAPEIPKFRNSSQQMQRCYLDIFKKQESMLKHQLSNTKKNLALLLY